MKASKNITDEGIVSEKETMTVVKLSKFILDGLTETETRALREFLNGKKEIVPRNSEDRVNVVGWSRYRLPNVLLITNGSHYLFSRGIYDGHVLAEERDGKNGNGKFLVWK